MDLRSDILVSVGEDAAHLQSSAAVIRTQDPVVVWQLPPGVAPTRYSVKISNAEVSGWAYATSGARLDDNNSFQYPLGAGMNDNFLGLCRVDVLLSMSPSGDYEWYAPPLYFVYDPNAAVLRYSDQVRIQWEAVAPSRPGTSVTYRVQVGADPSFSTVLFDDSGIGVTCINVPVTTFSPVSGTNYFVRVCANDGLDTGAWSRTYALTNLRWQSPTVSLNSTTPLNDADGSVAIQFTCNNPQGVATAVEMSIASAGSIYTASGTPLRTVGSLAQVPNGTSTVIWKAGRQLQATNTNGITLQARARDAIDAGPYVSLGPLDLDLTPTPAYGSVISALRFGVSSAIATHANTTSTITEPLTGDLMTMTDEAWDVTAPVASSPLASPKVFVNGQLETTTVAWANRIATNTTVNGTYDGSAPLHGRINPHTAPLAFIFRSPIDYAAQVDGWPRPHSSAELDLANTFLWGYYDAANCPTPYPDGYDWAHRPAWHAGREVWRQDDGWVQELVLCYTNYEACTVCGGSGWLPSGSPPNVVHGACTNPHCVSGFDTGKPHTKGTKNRWTLQHYWDVRWTRLSTWTQNHYAKPVSRVGLAVDTPTATPALFHVVGRQLSNTEAIWGTDGNGNPFIVKYVTTQDGITRSLPGTSAAPHVKPAGTSNTMTRQADDGTVLCGGMAASPMSASGTTSVVEPVTGHLQTQTTASPEVLPAQGTMTAGASSFIVGVNPNDSDAAATRAMPSQIQAAWLVTGCIHSAPHKLESMEFLFLPVTWDSQNQLHWAGSVSDSATVRFQYAQILDGMPGPWTELRDPNSIYDPLSGWWRTPGTIFDFIMDTSNRTQFPSGGTFRLRLQIFDDNRQSSTTDSSTFQIISGATNPVTITGMSYDPWSKAVTIAFDCSSTTGISYDLTAMYYSADGGTTWKPISTGDVYGGITNLASVAGQETHTVTWDTTSYDLPAGDNFRIRIDCLPTGASDNMVMPIFHWYTPFNPYLDAAQNELTYIMGYVAQTVYNSDTSTWGPANPPVYQPGRLAQIEREKELVRESPGTTTPNGMYSCMVQDPTNGNILAASYTLDDATSSRWTITDQTNYNQWLADPYNSTQSHGQAIEALENEQDDLNNVELPAAQTAVMNGERAIRKNMMDQGYFAEYWFPRDGTGEVITETITSTATGSELVSGPRTVIRYWRFRVQSTALGPTGVYNTDGTYSPTDLCPLDTVYYRWQMDATGTFDSQGGQPLRDVFSNADGTPLSVASSQTVAPITASNPTVDSANAETGDWTPTSSSSAPQMVEENGTYTMPPSRLPGHVTGDQLAAGQAAYYSPYNWRVAAYNPVAGQITALPRPLITQLTTQGGVLAVAYLAQAHPDITSMSTPAVAVATQTQATQWVDAHNVLWISDLRAPLADVSRQVNNVAWVPAGHGRNRVCVFHDDQKMQYVGMLTKLSYNNLWRPVGLRGMAYDQLCEYDVYFEDHPALAITGPCLLKVGGTYNLFMNVQMDSTTSPAIYFSSSTDADTWSIPVPISLANGANPSVLWDSTRSLFCMYYEAAVSGVSQVFYAESPDGINWGTPIQVTSDSAGVGAPSAARWSGQWMVFGHVLTSGSQRIMYYAGSSPTALTLQGSVVSQSDDGTYLYLPSYPAVMVDTYQGNQELFLFTTVQLMSGTGRTTQADTVNQVLRMEDYVWETLDSGDAPQVTVNSGTAATLYLARGFDPAAAVKVRINFTVKSPTSRQYYRQSAWVTPSNASDSSSVLSPAAFAYDPMLDIYPYMT